MTKAKKATLTGITRAWWKVYGSRKWGTDGDRLFAEMTKLERTIVRSPAACEADVARKLAIAATQGPGKAHEALFFSAGRDLKRLAA